MRYFYTNSDKPEPPCYGMLIALKVSLITILYRSNKCHAVLSEQFIEKAIILTLDDWSATAPDQVKQERSKQ